MNENLDLTIILEGCPVGTEFYSTIYGKCYFAGIETDKNYSIKLDFYTEEGEYHNDRVTIDGRHRVEYDGECTLYPSKDQRDWSKFERFWDKQKVKKFEVNTLAPFDKVLVRENARDYWKAVLFSHIDAKTLMAECNCKLWKQCIPYTLKTIHLVGTNNDCPEYYKWWEE